MFFKDNGIFLVLNDCFIPLSEICYDEKGYYLRKIFKNCNSESIEIWQCNDCGEIFSPASYNGYKCPNCGSYRSKPLHY